jgi:CHAT domain-containing protein
MAPQPVLDSLGGSIAGDELKGDYAAAERAAVAALEAARAAGDPAPLADAAIWASLVAALRTEPRTAAARLKEARAAVPGQPLARAAGAFARAAGRRMPDGNLSPPLIGTNPIGWPRSRKVELIERELFALTLLPVRGLEIQMELDSPTDVLLRDALRAGVRALSRVWDERPHARLAAAELYRRAGDQDSAGEHLDAAAAAYAAAGDAVGLARCDLARGAWAAVRFGSPLTLGLELSDQPVSSALSPLNLNDRILAPAPAAAASARHLQRAEKRFRAAGATRGAAMVDLHRAAVAALNDDPAGARKSAHRARDAFEAAGDAAHAHLAAAHGALAVIQAREWPERTRVAERIGAWGAGPGSPGWALGIGLLFSHAGWRWLRRDGDADRALACLSLAELTFAALGAADFASQTLADRASVHRTAGDLEAALAAAGQSLRGFAGLRERYPRVDIVLEQRETTAASITRLLAYQARDARRLELVRPALERQQARWEGLQEGEIVRDQLAWDGVFAPAYRALAARRRRPIEFRRQLERALEAAAVYDDAYRGQVEATVQLELGDRAAARQALARHPLPDSDPSDLDWLLTDARLLAAVEDWPEARRYHEALSKLRDDWWAAAPEPWSALGELARTAEGLGEPERARELFGRAIDTLEMRRGLVPRRLDRPPPVALYGDAARVELAAGSAETALALAERSRARGLLSDMARRAALTQTSQLGDELREWRELTARIEMLTWLAADGKADQAAALAEAEAALAAVESRLRDADPRWLGAVNPPATSLTADQIRAALPEGVLLIEHLLVRGALLSWAIMRNGVQGKLTPLDEVELDELQRKLWVACQGQSDRWERFAQPLGAALLDPFDDAIAAADQIVLVPHRRGFQAPLHAVPWRGAPLIEAKTVSVLPSASALRFVTVGGPPPHGGLLAVGDPSDMSRRRPGDAEPTAGFIALPWSGAQAAEAAAAFGADPLLGPDASERNVREAIGDARLVHFATHGELDEAPLLSCIVLADGDTLDVWELLGLPLDADLVTFSACDSAGSQESPTDELVGLGWLTLAAGARAVVASLWRVPELSTALLMRAFYRALHEEKRPREALAAAQRHVRGLPLISAQEELGALRDAAKAAGRPAPQLPPAPPTDFSHPYHWAGFVLIGV